MKTYLLSLGIIIITLSCITGVGWGLYLILRALFAWSAIVGGIVLGIVVIYFAVSILLGLSKAIDRYNANQGDK
ncbi:hypothetical protein [uncultured Limosilactobacillus sp.]|uniref:hypothetical protein n=1 Tax=uncultured Limosilactobacillus sp. TaxID=2837629 RepID=UPI0025CF681D|nr:hypothetical protein [uncultured Limosilactobacillus sp.]